MDGAKKLAKGAGYAFIGYGLSKFLSYIYRVLIARISPTDYGNLSIVLAIFGIFSLFSLIGLNVGVTRYVAFYLAQNDLARAKGIAKISLIYAGIISLILAAGLYLSSGLLAFYYKQQELELLFKVMAIAIPFYAVRDLLLAVTRGFQYAEYEVMIRMVLENLLKVIFTYLFLLMGLAALGATIATVIAIIISALISLYIVENKILPLISAKTPQIIDTELKKELLKYSIPVLLSTLVTQVFVWSDLLILGLYRPIEEVGIYNTALPTATLLSILPGGIIVLFLPIMTELFTSKNRTEFETTYYSCGRWIFFSIIPLFLFIMLFSKEILALVFGSIYGTGGAALSMLAIGYLVYHTLSPSIEILNVHKKTHIVLFNTTVSALLNIILNLLLIPKYGMLGGAFATTLSMCLLGIFGLFESYHYSKIHPLRRSYWKPIISGIISIAMINFIYPY